MSFATNMLRRSKEDGRFIRSRRDTKRTKIFLYRFEFVIFVTFVSSRFQRIPNP